MSNMIDLENPVILIFNACSFLLGSTWYVTPRVCRCHPFPSQWARISEKQFLVPQLITFVDLEDAEILIFHRECLCSCSLVVMTVSALFQSMGKDYRNGIFSVLR